MTDSLLARAYRGRRIVAVIAPAWVAKMNDVIGVVRGDGLGNRYSANTLPVGDFHAPKPRYASYASLVGNRYVEVERTGGIGVARFE